VTADRNPEDRGRVVCGDVLKHGDEISAAYWSGRTLDDLAAQWRVSLMTIMKLAYREDAGTVRTLPDGRESDPDQEECWRPR